MMDSRDAEAARLILRERGVSAGERDLQSLRIVSSRVASRSGLMSCLSLRARFRVSHAHLQSVPAPVRQLLLHAGEGAFPGRPAKRRSVCGPLYAHSQQTEGQRAPQRLRLLPDAPRAGHEAHSRPLQVRTPCLTLLSCADRPIKCISFSSLMQ